MVDAYPRMAVRFIAVDVSNVARSCEPLGVSYRFVRHVMSELKGYFAQARFIQIADANFKRYISHEERTEFEAACRRGELVMASSGVVADGLILDSVDQNGGLVVSNDSYREFHDNYPWVRHARRLIGVVVVPHVGVRYPWRYLGHRSGQSANPHDLIRLEEIRLEE